MITAEQFYQIAMQSRGMVAQASPVFVEVEGELRAIERVEWRGTVDVSANSTGDHRRLVVVAGRRAIP